MPRDRHSNKNGENGRKERDPGEVVELLKNFYKPEDKELEEFSEFYQSIEKKLEQENPANRIAQSVDSIEEKYHNRQFKFEQFLTKLEEDFQNNQQKITKKRSSRPVILALVIVAVIALTAIASYKYSSRYNYINLDSENIDWQILNLSEEQKKQLANIDNEWNEFVAKEKSTIADRREKLSQEINKEKPNFSLIDQYQRELLDHEVRLKREKLNTFLEKRFILNEEQSLKLIRQLNKAS